MVRYLFQVLLRGSILNQLKRVHDKCCDSSKEDEDSCYGCNPDLLAMGIPCEYQITNLTSTIRRDCSCGSSCHSSQNCCPDYPAVCSHHQFTWTTSSITATSSTTTTSQTQEPVCQYLKFSGYDCGSPTKIRQRFNYALS